VNRYTKRVAQAARGQSRTVVLDVAAANRFIAGALPRAPAAAAAPQAAAPPGPPAAPAPP
jgi:hypothetical protein